MINEQSMAKTFVTCRLPIIIIIIIIIIVIINNIHDNDYNDNDDGDDDDDDNNLFLAHHSKISMLPILIDGTTTHLLMSLIIH